MRKFTFLLYATIIFSGFLTGCSNMLEVEEGMKEGEENALLNARDTYFRYGGENIKISKIANKKFILFKASDEFAVLHQKPKIGNLITSQKMVLPSTLDRSQPFSESLIGATIEGMTSPNTCSEILYEAPYFQTAEGDEIGITNLFYVKLKEEKDIAQLAKLAEENNVEIIGNHNEMPLWYIISCSKQSTGNALELANEFYATNLFEICDPELIGDFVTFGSTVFSNRTVSTDTTVSGTDIISDNVTVNNGAKLTFVISNSITINGPFTVESGSELEIRK